jgi:hypothetical protein
MVRRVITANNAEGKSYFASDETVTDMTVWRSLDEDRMGQSPDGEPSRLLPSTIPGIEPPPGGSKCAFVVMEPWESRKANLAHGDIPGIDADGFHRTLTVDYIIMTKGEVTLLLDEGETTIRAGDLVVQRNTRHAWHVRGDAPAEFWGVMVSLKAESR